MLIELSIFVKNSGLLYGLMHVPYGFENNNLKFIDRLV